MIQPSVLYQSHSSAYASILLNTKVTVTFDFYFVDNTVKEATLRLCHADVGLSACEYIASN